MKSFLKNVLTVVAVIALLFSFDLSAKNEPTDSERLYFFAENLKSFFRNINYIKTPKKYKIMFLREESSHSAGASIFIKQAGYAYNPKNVPGLKAVAVELLNMGPSDISVKEYNKMLSDISASISYYLSLDSINITIHCRKDHFEEVFKICMKTLLSPRKDDESFKKALEILEKKIKSKNIIQSAHRIASSELRKKIFAGTKYGNDSNGDLALVEKIKKDSVLKDIASFANPERMEIIIGGNILEEEISKIVPKYLDDFPKQKNSPNSLAAKLFKSKRDKAIKAKLFSGIEIFDLGLRDSAMCFAQDGLTIDTPKSFATFVFLVHLLGGHSAGFEGQLIDGLRIKNGLVYYAYATPLILENASFIAGCMSYDQENQDKIFSVTKSILSELNNFSSISDEKIEDFKIEFIRSIIFKNIAGSWYDKMNLVEFTRSFGSDFDKNIDFAINFVDSLCELKSSDIKSLSAKIINPNKLGFVVAR